MNIFPAMKYCSILHGRVCVMISAFQFSAEAGNLELVRDITAQKEINIDAKTYNGQTALVVAYHRGHSRIVDFLKEKGADHDPAIIKQYGPVKRKLQRKDNLS